MENMNIYGSKERTKNPFFSFRLLNNNKHPFALALADGKKS